MGDILYVSPNTKNKKKCFANLFTNSETMDNGHWTVDSALCGQWTVHCVDSVQCTVWTVNSGLCGQWTVQCVDSLQSSLCSVDSAVCGSVDSVVQAGIVSLGRPLGRSRSPPPRPDGCSRPVPRDWERGYRDTL